MKMKKFKKLLAVLLTGIMVCMPATVMAEEADNVSAERQSAVADSDENSEVAPASLGDLIATGAGPITGGSGTITVTLPSGNWWADFVAGIAYTTSSSIVDVSVKTPDGKTFSLGSISGNGSTTSSHEETYAPAGDYIFYFSSSNTAEYHVVGYIYD